MPLGFKTCVTRMRLRNYGGTLAGFLQALSPSWDFMKLEVGPLYRGHHERLLSLNLTTCVKRMRSRNYGGTLRASFKVVASI